MVDLSANKDDSEGGVASDGILPASTARSTTGEIDMKGFSMAELLADVSHAGGLPTGKTSTGDTSTDDSPSYKSSLRDFSSDDESEIDFGEVFERGYDHNLPALFELMPTKREHSPHASYLDHHAPLPEIPFMPLDSEYPERDVFRLKVKKLAHLQRTELLIGASGFDPELFADDQLPEFFQEENNASAVEQSFQVPIAFPSKKYFVEYITQFPEHSGWQAIRRLALTTLERPISSIQDFEKYPSKCKHECDAIGPTNCPLKLPGEDESCPHSLNDISIGQVMYYCANLEELALDIWATDCLGRSHLTDPGYSLKNTDIIGPTGYRGWARWSRGQRVRKTREQLEETFQFRENALYLLPRLKKLRINCVQQHELYRDENGDVWPGMGFGPEQVFDEVVGILKEGFKWREDRMGEKEHPRVVVEVEHDEDKSASTSPTPSISAVPDLDEGSLSSE